MNVEELLEKYAAGVRDFTGIDLSEANLSSAKLSGVNLSRANLSVANLSGANLTGANLSYAKLNVARLSGVNLSNANLNNASLNVANLIRADLSRAQLMRARLIRAELIRADLSRADLSEANLSGADLREATLRQTNLRHANFSEAVMRGSTLTGANLEQANLNVADMSRCDLGGANLRQAELRQTNLSRANLSGANLSGANLRWADLSGANLRWTDLSDAKLSGANLLGADLSNTNLTNASLVHAVLTQARLIKAEWVGADLTEAILTGAKLYAVSRFGLKTERITCEWIDLSPTGDRSMIQQFSPEQARAFFNGSPPTIRIIIDSGLDHEASFALAGAYYHIAQQYPMLAQPPSIEIWKRRTVLTFPVERDQDLFPSACMAILPFSDVTPTQKNIFTAVQIIISQDLERLGIKQPLQVKKLDQALEQCLTQANAIRTLKKFPGVLAKIGFFQAPTQTILTNSSAQTLLIHEHYHFGKKFATPNNSADDPSEATRFLLPPLNMLVDFVKDFHYIDQ